MFKVHLNNSILKVARFWGLRPSIDDLTFQELRSFQSWHLISGNSAPQDVYFLLKATKDNNFWVFTYVCACSVAQLCLTFCNPTDYSPQAPLSMGFPWQEYQSRLPLPTPGDLPNPGMGPPSPASPTLAGRFFTTEPPGKPEFSCAIKCQHFNLFTYKQKHN